MFIAVLAAAAIGLSSCSVEREMEKISFGDIEQVQSRGVTLNRAAMDVYVEVENLSGRNVQVKEASADIFVRGKKILGVKLGESVKIVRRSSEVVRIPFIMEFGGMFGALSALPVIAGGMDQATADVDITVRSGVLRNRYRQSGIPLSALSSQFGIDVKSILENYK